jgi:hypothetical protein
VFGLLAVSAWAAAQAEGTALARTERLPARHEVFGGDTSASGFVVHAEVDHRLADERAWPYLTVEIRDRDGRVVYRSPDYAAWFEIRITWDGADRLWIASRDEGTDVIRRATEGWSRARWMPGGARETVLDARTGERVPVVGLDPPPPLASWRPD